MSTTFNPANIKTTSAIKAPLILIFALNGAGKSSFFASIKNPFVVDTEKKFKIKGKVSIYEPKDFSDIKGCLEWYLAQPALAHGDENKNGAFCIDSIDWLEHAIHEKIMADYPGATNINDDKIKALNYNKGNDLVCNIYFGEIYPFLSAIRLKHNIPIAIGAQAKEAKQERGDQDLYYQQDLRLQTKFKEKVSDLVEAKLYLKKEDNIDQAGKIFPTEERYMYTREAYGINAKNNLDLPERVKISCSNGWGDLIQTIGTCPPID